MVPEGLSQLHAFWSVSSSQASSSWTAYRTPRRFARSRLSRSARAVQSSRVLSPREEATAVGGSAGDATRVGIPAGTPVGAGWAAAAVGGLVGAERVGTAVGGVFGGGRVGIAVGTLVGKGRGGAAVGGGGGGPRGETRVGGAAAASGAFS